MCDIPLHRFQPGDILLPSPHVAVQWYNPPPVESLLCPLIIAETKREVGNV